MSKDQVEAFFDEVEEDKDLQIKLKAIDLKSGQSQQAVDELVRVAGNLGFDFTADEFIAARNKKHDTAAEAGGASEPVTTTKDCWIAWPEMPDPPCPHGSWSYPCEMEPPVVMCEKPPQ